MAIGDKKKHANPHTNNPSTPSEKMFEKAATRTTKVNLYVRDPELLKALKIAAVEEETSLSTLFEQWGSQWLDSRGDKSSQLFH